MKGKATSGTYGQIGYIVLEDFCTNPNNLREAFCTIDGKVSGEDYSCANGCSNGTCIANNSIQCIDSDSGINYYELGTTTKDASSYKDYCGLQNSTTHYIFEYYCDANQNINNKLYSCPNNCLVDQITSIGACVDISTPCTDTDGGINYNLKGTAKKGNVNYVDKCINAFSVARVYESYCNSSGMIIQTSVATCPNNLCGDGVCAGQQSNSCTDTDGGINSIRNGTVYGINSATNEPFSYSDSCTEITYAPTTATEYYCSNGNPTSETVTCNYGCKNNACNEFASRINCTDSDGGINYNLKGTASTGITLGSDFCVSASTLKEAYCFNQTTIKGIDYNCSVSCSSGACI
ncbi:MAG: hypothetical protein AABW75_03460 [Nanoarchaeota archaeon]